MTFLFKIKCSLIEILSLTICLNYDALALHPLPFRWNLCPPKLLVGSLPRFLGAIDDAVTSPLAHPTLSSIDFLKLLLQIVFARKAPAHLSATLDKLIGQVKRIVSYFGCTIYGVFS